MLSISRSGLDGLTHRNLSLWPQKTYFLPANPNIITCRLRSFDGEIFSIVLLNSAPFLPMRSFFVLLLASFVASRPRDVIPRDPFCNPTVRAGCDLNAGAYPCCVNYYTKAQCVNGGWQYFSCPLLQWCGVGVGDVSDCRSW